MSRLSRSSLFTRPFPFLNPQSSWCNVTEYWNQKCIGSLPDYFPSQWKVVWEGRHLPCMRNFYCTIAHLWFDERDCPCRRELDNSPAQSLITSHLVPPTNLGGWGHNSANYIYAIFMWAFHQTCPYFSLWGIQLSYMIPSILWVGRSYNSP